MVHLCTLWIGRPEIAKWRPSRLRLLEDKPANDLPNGFHQGGCIVTATERQRNCVPSAHCLDNVLGAPGRRDTLNRRLCKLKSNAINYLNPAHKSGDAWVRIASSVQSRDAAH